MDLVAWYSFDDGEVGLYYSPTDDIYTSFSVDVNDTDDPFRIGDDANGNNAFTGQIDQVGVWQRQLSPDEAEYFCSGEVTPNDPDHNLDNALAYWSFNTDASGTWADDEGTFDLTENGTVTVTAESIAGGAAFMAIDDDFLEYPVDGALDLSQYDEWTAQIWTRSDDPTFARAMGVFNQQIPERPWSIDVNGSDEVEGRIDGPTVIVNPGITLSTDTWYHFVLNFDGDQLCLTVNNGTPECEASDAPGDVANARFRIGAGVGGDGNPTNGFTHADEAGIWVNDQSWGDVPAIRTCMYNEGAGRSVSTKSTCNQ